MIKALIVDDISENLYMLESLLTGNGYKTISATNGAEALGLALKDTPDIIISDILMPVMDGYSFCRECKKDKKLKNIPFVFYTATYTHPKDEDFAMSLGADMFLIKPQEPDEFIAKIQNALNEFAGNKFQTHEPHESSELIVYKEYNETLIRKMEDRMLKSIEAENKIRNYATQLESEIEQKNNATKALKESEKKYRSIFENTSVAILLTEPNGNILSANNFACRLFQRTEEDICNVGRNGLIDILDPRLQILVDERDRTGRTTGELTFLKKDGSTFQGELSSVVFKDKEGNERTSMVIRDLTEQKKADDALLKNEVKYRTLTENLPDIVARFDTDSRHIYINSIIEKFTGQSPNIFIGKTVEEIGMPADSNALWIENMGKVIQTTEPQVFEFSYPTPEGLHFFLTQLVPEFNSIGKVDSILAVARDVTENRRDEELLKESEERFRSIFENATVGIYRTTQDGQIILANPALIRMLKYESFEDLITLNLELNAFDPEFERVKFRKIIESEGEVKGLEWAWMCKDKTTIYVRESSKVFRNAKGKVLYYEGMVEDISERKQIEEALRESQLLFQNLAQVSPVGIFRTNLEGNTTYVNPRWSELTGLSIEDAKDRKWMNAVHPDDRENLINSWNSDVKKQQTSSEEYRFLKPDGSIVWVIGNAVPEIKGSLVKGFIGTITDITEHKKAEEQLLIAKEKAEESDQLKTAFLHNISHEIRTPMNAIMGFSDLLKEPDLEHDKRDYFTGIITQSCDQLLLIITDIINIATIEAGQATVGENNVNLNSVLNTLLEQFKLKAKNQNISLSINNKLPDKEVDVLTDGIKITEILSNLLSNALKFTKEGFVNFGYIVNGSFVEFYIEDSGIGIPPALQDEIFKRFRQVEITSHREFGGSGLGLSISKSYVELLGGKIWLISQLGKGSTFYFTIPYKKINADVLLGVQDFAKPEIVIGEHKTLLIAEDNDFNFMLLEESLSEMNFTIIHANNGSEAVNIFKSDDDAIDLILMDIKMPIMSGFEAAKLITAIKPSIPIIALTAYSTELDKEKAFNSGCCDFISKPFKREQLLFKIKEQLQKP